MVCFVEMVLVMAVDTLAVLVAWAGSHLDGVDQAVLAEGGSGSSPQFLLVSPLGICDG